MEREGMNLSISNIAWNQIDDTRILEKIRNHGFSAIEITPSRIWKNFQDTDSTERYRYLKHIQSFGLIICSMHSLFWMAKDMALFGTKSEQKNLSDYFAALIHLAQDLQIPRMIFGSPSVRKKGQLCTNDAYERAAEILFPISERAYQCGTKILIEPLSPLETDFVSNHREGIELVKTVASKGFGLHLDAKAICSEDVPPDIAIDDSKNMMEHFHVNEEGLGSFRNAKLPHDVLAKKLKDIGYDGFVSIEMKQLENYESEIECALNFVKQVYGI